MRLIKNLLCPFCESGDDIYLDEHEGEITVGCANCGVHAHGYNKEREALKIWREYKARSNATD